MSKKPKIEKAVYTVPEIAALLGINLPNTYRLAKQPGFPAIRISNRRVVVPKDAFHRWLNSQSCGVSETQ